MDLLEQSHRPTKRVTVLFLIKQDIPAVFESLLAIPPCFNESCIQTSGSFSISSKEYILISFCISFVDRTEQVK